MHDRPGRLRRTTHGGWDVGARINPGGDAHLRGGEVGQGAGGVVIVGEHHGTAARSHGPAVEIAAHRTGQHHAGPVIAGEYQRPLDRTGCEDGAAGDDAPQALAWLVQLGGCQMIGHPLNRAVGAVIVGPEHRGARHQRGMGQGGEGGRHVLRPMGHRFAVDQASLDQRATTGTAILITQNHPRPALCRRQRRRQTGRTGTDHQHVAKDCGFLIVVRIGRGACSPQSSGAADDRLVELLPERGGPHEGLVVEPRREQRRDQIVDRQQIMTQRRETVLALGFQPVEQLGDGHPAVRLTLRPTAQSGERVRLLTACGEDAARAVIFERTPNQPHAIGQQGRGQRVTSQTGIVLPVEAEAQRLRPVDEPAFCQAERLCVAGHADLASAMSRAERTARTA